MSESTTRCNRCHAPLMGNERLSETCNRCLDLGYGSMSDAEYDALDKERHEMNETTSEYQDAMADNRDWFEEQEREMRLGGDYCECGQHWDEHDDELCDMRLDGKFRPEPGEVEAVRERVMQEIRTGATTVALCLALAATGAQAQAPIDAPAGCALSGHTSEGFPVATCQDGTTIYADMDGAGGYDSGLPVVEPGTWVPMHDASPVFP